MNEVKPTEKKVAANKQNAQKSTGPHNSSLTRYNATKHGLLSMGVTELDEPHKFHALLAQFKKELQPVGVLENECIDQIAVLTIRIRRARFLEAEAFTADLNPPETVSHPGKFAFDPHDLGWNEVVDPGLPAQVSEDRVDQINRTVVRYETAIEQKLFRWLNQLERLQRVRRGERVPAPATVDVNVHHGSDGVASFGNSAD